MTRLEQHLTILQSLADMNPPAEVLDAVAATLVANKDSSLVVIDHERRFAPQVIGVDLDGPDYGVAIVATMREAEFFVEATYRWPLR